MVSLLPDQKPPKPSSLVLFMIAECDMNYSKTSGGDWFKLCSRSPEMARSFLNTHQACSGPEARLWAPARARRLQEAERCCPLSQGQALATPQGRPAHPGKGPGAERLGMRPRHSLGLGGRVCGGWEVARRMPGSDASLGAHPALFLLLFLHFCLGSH